MSIQIQHVGGARIRRANATWPFATLTCSSNELVLNVFILGRYTFTKSNITKIEKYESIPIIGSGIKIEHTIPNYPKWIVFWYLRNPQRIIEELQAIEFIL